MRSAHSRHLELSAALHTTGPCATLRPALRSPATARGPRGGKENSTAAARGPPSLRLAAASSGRSQERRRAAASAAAAASGPIPIPRFQLACDDGSYDDTNADADIGGGRGASGRRASGVGATLEGTARGATQGTAARAAGGAPRTVAFGGTVSSAGGRQPAARKKRRAKRPKAEVYRARSPLSAPALSALGAAGRLFLFRSFVSI